MSEELNTLPTVPQAPEFSAGEGKGAEATITLDQFKAALGKDFKDVESALKSVKDTYSYVGSQAQYKQTIGAVSERLGTDEAGVLAALGALVPSRQEPQGQFISKETYETDQFFAQKPELNSLRDVLIPLKQAQGAVSWKDFLAQPSIASVVEGVTGYNELQSKKSVLQTNPRLGAASSKIDNARQAVSEGNMALAKNNAVSAVTDLLN